MHDPEGTPANVYKVVKYLDVPNVFELQAVGVLFEKLLAAGRGRAGGKGGKVVRRTLHGYLFEALQSCSVGVVNWIVEAYLGREEGEGEGSR